MPLRQLVHYFNDRFEAEHHSNIRPFFSEKKPGQWNFRANSDQ